MTQITTAARRIVRELSTTPAAIRAHFDAAGHLVDSHPADMTYTARPAWMDQVVFSAAGGQGWTEQQVQTALDAYQSYDPGSGLTRSEWVTAQLQEAGF